MRSFVRGAAVAAAVFALAGARPAPIAAQGAQSVDRDSITSYIRFLSIDPFSGELRSRFVLREAPLAAVADTLAARLGRATGETAHRVAFAFEKTYAGEDSTYTAENIAALLPGSGAIPGAVLLTAHFDAIAGRTTGWSESWKTLPCPGANDNGSGTAAVLDAARVLCAAHPGDLPFDLLFVMFSAEEFDRMGSTDFVPRLAEVYGNRIIATINLDMIGYAYDGVRGATIESNPSSGWLAELMTELDAASPSGLALEVLNPGPANSDHQAFWTAGISAVSFIERFLPGGHVAYPYYHTMADTIGHVDVEQVARVADFAVDFVEHLAVRPAEVGLFSSDLLLRRRGFYTALRTFAAGDTVSASVRPRNTGALDAAGTVRLRVTLENSRGIRVLFDDPVPAPGALDAPETILPIPLDASLAGENVVRAFIVVDGMEDDPSNNAASIRFAVEADTGPVIAHGMQPNPIHGDLGSAAFGLNLAEPVDMRIDVFTIEGEILGSARLGPRYGKPLAAGMNRVALSAIVPDPGRLASGIYLYRIDVQGAGAPDPIVGRFAVQR